MPAIQRVVKPTTRKGKKFLQGREPKVIENCKQSLFMNGRKVNEELKNCFKDLYKLKKPHAQMLGKKNDVVPFENVTPIESSCKKLDASLFFFASNSKKRPNNLVLGRLFDHQLLDMIELCVTNYKGIKDFPASNAIPLGTKPCLLFAGELWENGELAKVKNVLIDSFRGEVIEGIRLQGLEHVYLFTATRENILVRSYRILLKKSSTKLPRVELAEMGPSMDLVLKRTRFASEDLMRSACRIPQESRSRPKKNISVDKLGTKHARVHLGKQNVGTIQTRKMKGLRKTMAERKADKKRKSGGGASPAKKTKSS